MNPVKENIDSRILRLLGLEDVFDLDYSTYATLLKEKLIEVTKGSKGVPHEEVELLHNEFKRVRTKEGRFAPKAKKVRVDNVTNLGSMRRLPGTADKKKSPTQQRTEERKEQQNTKKVADIFTNIKNSLSSINKTIKDQLKLDRKRFGFNRRRAENNRRRDREDRLESVKQQETISKRSEKVLAPFQGFFDNLLNFVVQTLLGRAVTKFFEFAEDPKNKQRLETLGKFLKDWWPALTAAWFLFATPIGGIVRTITGTIAKWTLALIRQIPKLVRLIRRNPMASLATTAVVGTAIAAYFANQDGSAVVQDPNDPNKSQMDEINQFGGMIGSPLQGLFGNSNGGLIGMMGGGNVFSGLVGRGSGTTVSGAGPDTQFFPVEGGGGAVLQRGESVLQVGARERIMNERGFDPLSYNTGPNANRPRRLKSISRMFGMNMGGVVGQKSVKVPTYTPPGGMSRLTRNVSRIPQSLRRMMSGGGSPRFKVPAGPLSPSGVVTSSTGMDVGGRGVDTQYIPSATVQIGEAVRVFTKDSVDSGLLPLVDYFESILDPVGSQSSRRIGGSARSPFIPTPPVRRTPAASPTVLPAIDSSVAATVDTGNDNTDGVPEFSATPSSATSARMSNATVYGIAV